MPVTRRQVGLLVESSRMLTLVEWVKPRTRLIWISVRASVLTSDVRLTPVEGKTSISVSSIKTITLNWDRTSPLPTVSQLLPGSLVFTRFRRCRVKKKFMVSVVNIIQQSVTWQSTTMSTILLCLRKSLNISRNVALTEFTLVIPGRVPDKNSTKSASSRIRKKSRGESFTNWTYRQGR